VTEVRRATRDDLDGLVWLRRAWTEERHGVGADETYARRFAVWFEAEAPRRSFWLATEDGEPVGMANLVTFERMPGPGVDASRWGYLGNMFVASAHRGRGVGRALLDAVISHAEAEAFERIVLSPSERSLAFYRRAGFHSADELLLRPRR